MLLAALAAHKKLGGEKKFCPRRSNIGWSVRRFPLKRNGSDNKMQQKSDTFQLSKEAIRLEEEEEEGAIEPPFNDELGGKNRERR